MRMPQRNIQCYFNWGFVSVYFFFSWMLHVTKSIRCGGHQRMYSERVNANTGQTYWIQFKSRERKRQWILYRISKYSLPVRYVLLKSQPDEFRSTWFFFVLIYLMHQICVFFLYKFTCGDVLNWDSVIKSELIPSVFRRPHFS